MEQQILCILEAIMCLATAYFKSTDEDQVLAKNISNIEIDGEWIIMTDILGTETKIKGKLKKADLVNGVVEILAA